MTAPHAAIPPAKKALYSESEPLDANLEIASYPSVVDILETSRDKSATFRRQC